MALSRSVQIAAAVALAGGAVYAFRSAGRLAAVGDNLRAEVREAKIHSFGFDGLVVKVALRLKNPTAGSLWLIQPDVELFSNDARIGDSNPSATRIDLPAFGTVEVPPITITLPVFSLLGPLKGLLTDLLNGAGTRQPVSLTVRVRTRVNGLLPVVSDITVPLVS